MNSYNVWNYAEGHDSYYSAMLVDLTLPPDKVSNFIINIPIIYRTSTESMPPDKGSNFLSFVNKSQQIMIK